MKNFADTLGKSYLDRVAERMKEVNDLEIYREELIEIKQAFQSITFSIDNLAIKYENSRFHHRFVKNFLEDLTTGGITLIKRSD